MHILPSIYKRAVSYEGPDGRTQNSTMTPCIILVEIYFLHLPVKLVLTMLRERHTAVAAASDGDDDSSIMVNFL